MLRPDRETRAIVVGGRRHEPIRRRGLFQAAQRVIFIGRRLAVRVRDVLHLPEDPVRQALAAHAIILGRRDLAYRIGGRGGKGVGGVIGQGAGVPVRIPRTGEIAIGIIGHPGFRIRPAVEPPNGAGQMSLGRRLVGRGGGTARRAVIIERGLSHLWTQSNTLINRFTGRKAEQPIGRVIAECPHHGPVIAGRAQIAGLVFAQDIAIRVIVGIDRPGLLRPVIERAVHLGQRRKVGRGAVAIGHIGRRRIRKDIPGCIGDLGTIGQALGVAHGHIGIVGVHCHIIALMKPGFGDGLFAAGAGRTGHLDVVEPPKIPFGDVIEPAAVQIGGDGGSASTG